MQIEQINVRKVEVFRPPSEGIEISAEVPQSDAFQLLGMMDGGFILRNVSGCKQATGPFVVTLTFVPAKSGYRFVEYQTKRTIKQRIGAQLRRVGANISRLFTK